MPLTQTAFREPLAALVLCLILSLTPLLGIVLTEAPWPWPILTLTLAASAFLLTTTLHRKALRLGTRLLIVNAIFLLNAAFFASYYMQDEGFNDVFFYHAQPDVIHAGLGEFLNLALLAAGALIAINLLTPFAAMPLTWCRGRLLSTLAIALLGAGSLLLFPPLLSLIAYHHPGTLPDLPAVLPTKAAAKRVAMPNTERILEDLAAAPRLAGTGPDKLPHLILIYLESVEQRYFDQDLFPGLLPELTALRGRSLDVPNMFQAPGTGWTIAGMTASQCGYPLISAFRGGANDLGILPTFMPDAVCFGDLMSEAGYALTYMGGADHRFAGKGNFYRSHGFDHVYGFKDLKDRLADPDDHHHWGLFDDTLLDMAHDEFLTMAASEKPAGLVLLTLDTHHPGGYPSASCAPYEEVDNEILHAVHCTDQLVADFVRRIRETPHADDTYIVIASDHLAMRNTASGMLNAPGDPRRLTFFIDTPDQAGPRLETTGMHYDMMPTVFDLIGIEIDGQLGLGRSLLHQDGYLPTLIGIETAVNARPDKKLGEHIAGLWSLGSMTIAEGLIIDLPEGAVTFGGHRYDLMTKRATTLLPTLFTFDNDRLQLTGLYQGNPGDPEPDGLTAKILRNETSLHLAIGPYLSLKGMVETVQADGLLHQVSSAPADLSDDDLVIFLGKADASGIVARPSSELFEISGSDIERLVR